MLPSFNNDPIIISNYSSNNDQTTTLLYHNKHDHHLFSNLCHQFPTSPTFLHYETDNNDDFFLQQYQDLPLITTLTDNNTTNYYNPTTSTAAETTEEDVINSSMVQDDYSNKVLVSTTTTTTTTSTTTPPRKRTSKRDRHSKINTAQGPRDRRMRLSLEIAREFFGLQDILGYDKASRTVEWLLSKAESDIKKLVAKSSPHHLLIQSIDSSSTTTVVGAANTTSSASECEVISGGIIDHHDKLVTTTDQKPSKCANNNKEKKRLREVLKPAFRPARARESREMARARARERTKVKKMCANKSKLFAEDGATTTNQDSNQVGSSRSPTSLEVHQLAAEVEKPSSHEVQQDIGATTDDMVHDDDHHSLVIMDKWSPASIFNYMHGSNGISQEHQFADFQFYGKPWESYNIQSILYD